MGTNLNYSLLRQSLNELAAQYNDAYLQTDPVAFVHRYSDPIDQEVVGWVSAAFAYGRVAGIFRTLETIFSEFSQRPAQDLRDWRTEKWLRAFGKFSHRFSNAGDLVTLLFLVHRILRTYGSLGTFFEVCWVESDGTVKGVLTRAVEKLKQFDLAALKGVYRQAFWYLLPSPKSGSACKRWNLFLRWMVRPADGIDLGLWDFLQPSQLLLPLDTHTARLSRLLGLTDRKSASWKMAEEVTGVLRKLDPQDPVRFDFALSRLGILKICPGKKNAHLCKACQLFEICQA